MKYEITENQCNIIRSISKYLILAADDITDSDIEYIRESGKRLSKLMDRICPEGKKFIGNSIVPFPKGD